MTDPQPSLDAERPQIELGPCALHDHFGSGECPDCDVRRKLSTLEDRLRQLSAKWRRLIAEEDNDEWGRERVSVLTDCADDLDDALLSERPTP